MVSLPLNKNLYLFEGKEGRGLKDNGLATTGSGLVVPCLWSGCDWSGLFRTMLNFSRARVQRLVGSGSSSKTNRVGDRGSLTSSELLERLGK
jgi:hypothetical protein